MAFATTGCRPPSPPPGASLPGGNVRPAANGPWVGPDAGHGTGSIHGTAVINTKDWGPYHAAGREVWLVPKTPETAKWAANPNYIPVGQQLARGLAAQPSLPTVPESVRRVSRMVYGYGLGRFDFEGLPAGAYYILFRPWELKDVYAMTEVSIGPGESRRDVSVTTTTDKGGW
jgi:hypothetical protein